MANVSKRLATDEGLKAIADAIKNTEAVQQAKEEIQAEGTAQVQVVQNAAQEIAGKVEQIQQNTDDVAELKSDLDNLSIFTKGCTETEQLGYMYITSDGHIGYNDTTNYKCKTQYFNVSSGDKILYYGQGTGTAIAYAFFNNDVFVSSGQGNYLTEPLELTIPSGVNKVVFSSFDVITGNVILKTYIVNGEDVNSKVKSLSDKINKLSNIPYFIGEYTETKQKGFMWIHDGIIDYYNENFVSITRTFSVKEGDIFTYYGIGNNDASEYVLMYDNIIISSGKGNHITEPLELTIPSGVNKVIFSSFATSYDDIVLKVYPHNTILGRIFSLENKTNSLEKELGNSILNNKKWVVCGDSYSHGDFSGGTEPIIQSGKYRGRTGVYAYLIGNRTNMDIVMDFANNGSTLAQNDGTQFSMVLNYQNIPSDADYITFYFGINDRGWNRPIGDIDSDDTYTFCGAYNTIISWLIENRPNAQIGIIGTNGSSLDYVNASKNIAKKYGLPFIDMNDYLNHSYCVNSIATDMNQSIKSTRDSQLQVGNGNIHPNGKMHEIESHFIEEWLKNI